MLTAEKIREIAETFLDNYEVVGIRTQEVPFELGKSYHNSLVWVDGEMTGEELTGICATNVFSSSIWDLKKHTGECRERYYGNHVALICGNAYSWGADEGEIIIEDPVVVEILK